MEQKVITETKLKQMVQTLSTKALLETLEQNIGLLFSSPDVSKLYPIIKDIDLSQIDDYMPKIMMAWLAFICGNHQHCFMLIESINETNLASPEESSFFYSLKALMSSMLDTKEGIRYAKLSIDVLSQNEKSLFHANAYLTYGQILSGTDQYEKAAKKFLTSYQIFYSLNLHFLAVIAFVNEVLNLYKIGKYQQVIKKCEEALIISGNFKEEKMYYWNLIHLPLGLCYYELYKPSLALNHFNKAKDSIDKFDLYHMYGLTEIYLFKTYFILNDKEKMDKIKIDFIKKFEHMQHPTMDLIIMMFKIYSNKQNLKAYKPIIERLETEHIKGVKDSYSVVIELLVYLKIKGLSDAITIEDLRNRLNHFININNVSMIQLTLIQLSELCLIGKNNEERIKYLKQAVEIYKKYKIYANFYLVPIKSIDLIKHIDSKLYNELKKTHQNIKQESLLTEREKEIIKHMALGKSNAEMSKDLFISVGTIKWHINNIFSKLHVKNRIKAIEKAKELGEID